MGAPKQKWTPEEEAALKAGVLRHGQGKWRTILKDPEFSGVLYLRSNVDLKDKWRNMSVMANGLGSREKARLALKRLHQTPKQNESPMTLANVAQSDEDTSESKPVATSSDSPRPGGSRRSIIRLDNLIMDAINNLKESGGSNKTAISAYIEDQYWAPPNFKRLLSAKLKYLTATGKLVKMKQKYRIATTLTLSERRRNPPISLLEGRQKLSPKRDDIDMLTKSQFDSELSKMRSMTPEEAAAAAAQAVAEAEAAIAEAEEAAREAEAAEAEAEAAQAFAEAAMKTLQWRSTPRTLIGGMLMVVTMSSSDHLHVVSLIFVVLLPVVSAIGARLSSRNRLEHKRLNDLVYVQYNEKNAERFQKQREAGNDFNPLVLEDFQWDNEWVHSNNVHPGEDLSWLLVDDAIGASDTLERRNYSRRGQVGSTSGASDLIYQRCRSSTSTSRLRDDDVESDEDAVPFPNDDDDVTDDEDVGGVS